MLPSIHTPSTEARSAGKTANLVAPCRRNSRRPPIGISRVRRPEKAASTELDSKPEVCSRAWRVIQRTRLERVPGHLPSAGGPVFSYPRFFARASAQPRTSPAPSLPAERQARATVGLPRPPARPPARPPRAKLLRTGAGWRATDRDGQRARDGVVHCCREQGIELLEGRG